VTIQQLLFLTSTLKVTQETYSIVTKSELLHLQVTSWRTFSWATTMKQQRARLVRMSFMSLLLGSLQMRLTMTGVLKGQALTPLRWLILKQMSLLMWICLVSTSHTTHWSRWKVALVLALKLSSSCPPKTTWNSISTIRVAKLKLLSMTRPSTATRASWLQWWRSIRPGRSCHQCPVLSFPWLSLPEIPSLMAKNSASSRPWRCRTFSRVNAKASSNLSTSKLGTQLLSMSF